MRTVAILLVVGCHGFNFLSKPKPAATASKPAGIQFAPSKPKAPAAPKKAFGGPPKKTVTPEQSKYKNAKDFWASKKK